MMKNLQNGGLPFWPVSIIFSVSCAEFVYISQISTGTGATRTFFTCIRQWRFTRKRLVYQTTELLLFSKAKSLTFWREPCTTSNPVQLCHPLSWYHSCHFSHTPRRACNATPGTAVGQAVARIAGDHIVLPLIKIWATISPTIMHSKKKHISHVLYSESSLLVMVVLGFRSTEIWPTQFQTVTTTAGTHKTRSKRSLLILRIQLQLLVATISSHFICGLDGWQWFMIILIPFHN